MTYEEWKKNRNQWHQASSATLSRSGTEESGYEAWKNRKQAKARLDALSLVDTWLAESAHTAYTYEDRYKQNGKYRSDSAEWLELVTGNRDRLRNDAQEIGKYLWENRSILGNDFIAQASEAIRSGRKYHSDAVRLAEREAKYWSQWDSEESYNQYMTQKEPQQSGAAETNDYPTIFEENPQWKDDDSGWDAYLSENQADEKNWFEKALAMLAGSGDSSLPGGEMTGVASAYRGDTSYREPNDNWTAQQKNVFGFLYQRNPEEAYQYAEALNNSLAREKKDATVENIQNDATSGFWPGAANTAGALATAPLGMADYLNNILEYNARGTVSEKDHVTPFEYSQAVTGGISQNLNEKFGTLNDSIPIIGGKGLGDVYGLGTSIAQSAIAAYTGGQGGALIQFFGSAGASGFEDAKRRGASDDQAITYGTLSGAAEALAEMVGVDNLLKIGSSTTLRGFMKNVLKQASAEGLEEGITSLMNNFSDQLVMADKSNFYIKVQAYMNNGLSEEEAKKRAWMDMAEDIAFDMLGGFVSGGVHAGPQTAYQTYIQSKNADANAQQTGEDLSEAADDAAEAYEEEIPVQPVKEPVVPVQPQRTEAPVRQAEVPAQQVQKPVATVQPQRTEAPVNQTVVPAQQEADPVRQLAEQVSAEQTAPRQETAPANTDGASRKAQPLPGQENAPATGTVDAQNKEVVQKPSVAETVPAKVRSIASIKDGKATLKMEDGSEVASADAFIDPNTGVVIDTITGIDGISVGDANYLLDMLNAAPGNNQMQSAIGAKEAYKYGYYGMSEEYMVKHGSFVDTLTETQRKKIYETGRNARQTQATAKATAKKATANKSSATGKVHFEGDRSSLTERQLTSLTALEKVSEALGVQIHVFESQVGENGKRTGANGWYDPKDSSIHIDLHAGSNGEGTMLFTAAHELTHHIREWSPEKFKTLSDFLMQEYGKKDVSVDNLVRYQIAKAKRNGRTLSYDAAFEEVVADSMETMLSDGKVMEKLAKLKQKDQSLWQKVKDFISELAAKIRKVYEGLSPDSLEGQYVSSMVDSIDKLQELFVEALVDAGDNYQASLIPGEEGTVVNGNGDPVALATEDGSVLLSMRTYEEDGRKAFRDYLQKCVTSDKLTKAEMQEMIDGIEEIYQTCKEFKDKYAPFGSWSDAAVVRDTHGRPVFSVVTPNGDYKMNLDFSLVCKKRRTLDAVFNEMSRRGIIDDFELGQKSVVKINEIIRKHGLETACALCFVDAKRFRQASMADSFVRLYNELVESLVPADQRSSIDHFNFAGYETIRKVDSGIDTWANSELDFSHLDYVMKNYEKGTVEHKAARYIKTHPEGRRLLLRGDFMSSKGFDAVKTQNMDVMKLYNSKKGTGGPKAAFGDVQYMNEIINKARTWTPAKAYAVGGIRIQSFSDYVPRMVFDYTQMIYDLAATKLPAHAYTKEALFVKQFGLTGVKINMSLIPAIAEGGVAPGLDANGDYVWAGESFDFETAKQIQNAEGYTENCGTICVGVSYQHILKLLSDPNIRMVIPYHKSGLNPIVAHMNKVAKFTDYTSLKTNPGGCQSTIDKNGKKVANDFNFNEVLRKTGDPKATVRQYLDWCAKNGHTPRFAEFAWHENYYKLIEDFTLYDKDGNYVPQREVRAVFPKADSTFGSMKDLIQEGLEEDAVVEGKRDSSLSSIVDEIQDTLPRTEDEISEDQVAQADHDLEADVKYSDRDYLSAVNRGDVSTARKMVDEAAKKAGYTPVTRWHQTGENFTRFSTDNPVAGLNDSETPNGIFFKTNDHDIGLEGKKQMPLYLKLNNALHFANRREANAWYREKVPGYGKLHQEYDEAIKPLSERMDELEDQIFATDDDDEIAALEAKEDETLGEMKSIEDDFRARLRRLLDDYFLTGKSGYDGIELDYDGHRWVNGKREDVHTFIAFHPSQAKSADPVTYDDSGNVIPLSERFSQASDDIRYSDRDSESVSNRSLLANAFEGAAQTDKEREKIQEYRGKIDLIQAEEQKLRELNAQIRELSFAKGKRDTQKIRELRDQATETANRISVYDQQLLRLEASKPLQDMLAREKKRAYQQAEQRHKEAQEAYRLKAEVRQSEILRDYRETRAALRQSQSETALMEKEFIRLVKAYEKLEAKSTAKSGKDTQAIADLKAALKEEAKAHRQDQKLWEAEFNRLMREYEASDRNIEKLQAKIERQKQMAKDKADRQKSSGVREKIKNFKAKLERTLTDGTERTYVPVQLFQAMVDVCNLIDTDTELYNADGSINKAQEKRNLTKEKLQNLKDEYEKLRTNSDPIYAGEFDEMVYAYLTQLRDNFSGKNLKEMSLDELTEMYEILRAIDGTLLEARKLIGRGEARSVYEVADAIVSEQKKVSKRLKGGKRNAVQKARDASLNLSLAPVRNVERMSGYDQSSSLLKLFKQFEKGIRKKNKFVMDAYKSFEKLTSSKEYEKAMYTEVGGKKYTDVNGRKFGVSKMQMMQAILSYERETANGMHHIEGSGFSFADLDMLRKGKLRDAVSEEHSHRVPAAVGMVEEFAEALRGDKWCQAYMRAARGFFNITAKDAINETSIVLKHRIIARDKSYIPFEVDKNFVVREISAENNIQQTINAYGMLKETKKGASQPLIITGLNNIIDRHIDQVGNVYGLAIEVRNFNKVWNARTLDADGSDPTVKAAIQRNWGIEGVKHIEQAVQDIQGRRIHERSAIYDKVKSGYIGATFLLNLSVVTKQIGSLYSATSMLRWRNPVSQVGNLLWTMVNHKKISAEVDKYTATAWMRRQGLSDAELHTLMTEGKKTLIGGLVDKLPAVLHPGKWISAMDSAVALSLWKYAKQDTAKRTGLKGEALLQATAEFYDEVVENTQSMSDVLHRPEIQKKGDILSESLGMFKTDLYQMAGQLQVTAGRFSANKSKENSKAMVRTVYAIAMSSVWAQLMTTVFALARYKVNHYRDEEDEDLTAESWLKRQGFSFAGDLMGYVMPIFGSEIVGFLENIVYGESGEIVDSLALTAINDLYDTMITLGSSIKEGEMPKPEDMKKLTTKALQILGVPASNILRTIEAVRLHAKDIANGEFLSFEAGVDRSPKHHIHRIIEAVDAGNMDLATDLYEVALDEEEMTSLQTALGNKYKNGEVGRDTAETILSEFFELEEDDLYWLLDKWDYAAETGSSEGYAKFDDFLTAVQTGQNLKAVIKQYTDNGVEEKNLKSQISTHFKPMYMAMSTSERANIKGYLLNALTILGDTREDAEEKLAKWEFEADHPELVDRITYTQYKRWQTDGKPNGVSVELFTDVAEYRDNGSETRSQDEVMYYIMSLTRDKRTRHALWCCFYKESTSPFT